MSCGCLDTCSCYLFDTNTISITGDGSFGNPYAASLIPDANACNLITVSANGVLASLNTADSASVDFSGCGTVGNPLTATAVVDPLIVDLGKSLVFQVSGYKFLGGASSSYVLGNDSSDTEASPISTSGVLYSVPFFRNIASIYSITGRATRLTMVSNVTRNGTAPNTDILIQLYPVTTVGGGC